MQSDVKTEMKSDTEAFFDFDRFEAIDPVSFRAQKPFPFVNPSGLLLPGAWERLETEMPKVEIFEQRFGKKRYAGQQPHDRYSLEYTEDLPVSSAWHRLIGELRSDRYRAKVRSLLGVKKIALRFHWHYTPSGRGVSPHVDQLREVGSHIFYFNPPTWQESWGGQTLILGSESPIERRSAPTIEDFDAATQTECTSDRSLLFRGSANAWHAVKEIDCPESKMRRVFIVVFNATGLYWRVRDRLIGKRIQQF